MLVAIRLGVLSVLLCSLSCQRTLSVGEVSNAVRDEEAGVAYYRAEYEFRQYGEGDDRFRVAWEFELSSDFYPKSHMDDLYNITEEDMARAGYEGFDPFLEEIDEEIDAILRVKNLSTDGPVQVYPYVEIHALTREEPFLPGLYALLTDGSSPASSATAQLRTDPDDSPYLIYLTLDYRDSNYISCCRPEFLRKKRYPNGNVDSVDYEGIYLRHLTKAEWDELTR